MTDRVGKQAAPGPASGSKPRPAADWMTSGAGHPRRWAILGVLVVSLLIVVLDNTVLNIALPTIQGDLAISQGELVWAVDSYILAFAALLFTWGVIGDRIGRKRVLVIGMIIFGVASAICAFSVNAGMLIGFRTIMGIGGAAVLPTTLAIITVVFPPHERGKAIGMWAGAVGAAVALGPVLGGLLLQHPDWFQWLTGNAWGSVFLINVPIVIIGLIGIARVVPETRNPQPRRLDLVGVVISVVGLVLLVYGIIHASATRSWIDIGVLGPIIGGVVVLGIFVWLERRSDHPSFDVSLFANRGYAISLAAVSLAFFALSGITFSLPFYLQILRGYDTLIAGLCFVPFAVGQLLAAPRSASVVQRFGYRPVMTGGLVTVAVSLTGLLFLTLETPVWLLLLIFFAFGFGMGNVIAPASTVMQNVLPLARAGAGSAVQNTVRQVGGALGVAIIGTVLATRYAANLDQVLPSNFPARDAASESIVATAAVLNKADTMGVPTAVVDQVRNGAFEAFLSASHTATVISLIIVVIAALLVGFGLPSLRPPTKGAAHQTADPTERRLEEEAADYTEQASDEYPGSKRSKQPDQPDQPERTA
ncbi:MAG: MFS transporter [Actinomycetales bacterium]|nr:MFS transporter [Actinomycetales bacterium]